MQKKLNKLIKQIQAGYVDAFEDFYKCSYRLLYGVAFGVLHNQQQVEDAIQEAYISIYKNIDKIDIEKYNIINYIYTVVKNKAINIVKKNRIDTDVDDEILINSLGDRNIKPIKTANILKECKRVLTEDEYEIVVLSQIQGFKRREIAEMLSSNINTITWKYQRALSKLKQSLKEDDYEY